MLYVIEYIYLYIILEDKIVSYLCFSQKHGVSHKNCIFIFHALIKIFQANFSTCNLFLLFLPTFPQTNSAIFPVTLTIESQSEVLTTLQCTNATNFTLTNATVNQMSLSTYFTYHKFESFCFQEEVQYRFVLSYTPSIGIEWLVDSVRFFSYIKIYYFKVMSELRNCRPQNCFFFNHLFSFLACSNARCYLQPVSPIYGTTSSISNWYLSSLFSFSNKRFIL